MIDALRNREQANGEKIGKYLTHFREMVAHLRRAPAEKTLLDRCICQPAPEYRRSIRSLPVNSLEDVDRYGRQFERQKHMDAPYVPPPPKELMRFFSTAYTGPLKTVKLAAAKEVVKTEETVATVVVTAANLSNPPPIPNANNR